MSGCANYWVFAMAFGLIAPTLVGWFVVPLIKGTPPMGGPPWIIQVVRPIPNIAFGFGAAGRPRMDSRDRAGSQPIKSYHDYTITVVVQALREAEAYPGVRRVFRRAKCS